MSQNVNFTKLQYPPEIAWPTVCLLIVAGIIWSFSVFFSMNQQLPWILSFIISTLCVYCIYITIHDASHNAVFAHSKHSRALNTWFGRVGMLFFHPLVSFSAFRYLHMQHHRHTNDAINDPDMWNTAKRLAWLPFKWFTLDIGYIRYYIQQAQLRPRTELVDTALTFVLVALIMGLLTVYGYGGEILIYWLLPARIALFLLVFTLDFLPHYPKDVLQSENPFQATTTRMGMEWLMTPLLLNQNYHVIHHLYPLVPYYRTHKIWKAREAYFLAQNPRIVKAFSFPQAPNRE